MVSKNLFRNPLFSISCTTGNPKTEETADIDSLGETNILPHSDLQLPVCLVANDLECMKVVVGTKCGSGEGRMEDMARIDTVGRADFAKSVVVVTRRCSDKIRPHP